MESQTTGLLGGGFFWFGFVLFFKYHTAPLNCVHR